MSIRNFSITHTNEPHIEILARKVFRQMPKTGLSGPSTTKAPPPKRALAANRRRLEQPSKANREPDQPRNHFHLKPRTWPQTARASWLGTLHLRSVPGCGPDARLRKRAHRLTHSRSGLRGSVFSKWFMTAALIAVKRASSSSGFFK